MAANAGYVQLRRGILEHLASGRITSDEYAAYTVVIMAANHRTGTWKGSGRELAAILHWCARKAQYILAALAKKGYLAVRRIGHSVHAYLIQVAKYFPQAGAPTCVRPQELAHPDAHQEQEVNLQEEKPRGTTPRAHPLRSEHEQRRIVEARDQRLAQERAVSGEAAIGAPPRAAISIDGGTMEDRPKVRPDYIEFVDLRDAKRLPPGMTWTIWRDLAPPERQQRLDEWNGEQKKAASA